MIKAIKNFIDLKSQLKQYKIENARLTKNLSDELKKVGDPRYVVEKVLGRELKYFEEDKLGRNERIEYFNNAQLILNNKTLQNEIHKLMADWIEYAAKESEEDVYGKQSVRDMRMCISALELIVERLESIPNPAQKNDVKEPYSNL